MMRLSKRPCSETTTGQHPVVVLEGMPGAGKTTALTTLAAGDHIVIGEYTTKTGALVPIHQHPAVDDDAGHQHNWLLKHRHIHTARSLGPVFVDRDWLSALAYAYSVADTDHGTLLSARAGWVSGCIGRGALSLGTTYVLFHVEPAVSLRRRAHRLTPGHPWSGSPGLIRLARFYSDPAAALAPVDPELARRLGSACWSTLHNYSIARTVAFLREIVDRR